MSAIGLDIGGANLKGSDGHHKSISVPFPLWQRPHELTSALQQLLQQFPDSGPVAVTMTGELADCFRTRSEGVFHILEAAAQAAGNRTLLVWQTTGELVSVDEAWEFPQLVAAGNWHALATWAGRMAPSGGSLLIDIGSTTTDIIPIEDGFPVPQGRTDLERLQSGELIYAGVRRTPIASLIQELDLRGTKTALAREVFATTLDAFLWRGEIPEAPDNRQTANGQPCTRTAAGERLARMVCSDTNELEEEDLDSVADAVISKLISLIHTGIDRQVQQITPPVCVLLTGEGEFLARKGLQACQLKAAPEIISLKETLGPEHSAAACAFALSRIASEILHGLI